MSRRRKIWLTIGVVLLVLGGVFLWALPKLILSQAVARIPALTGRQVSIKEVRLAERDPAKAFVEFERLEARWSWLSLPGAHIRLTDVRLVAPVIQLVRTGPRAFN